MGRRWRRRKRRSIEGRNTDRRRNRHKIIMNKKGKIRRSKRRRGMSKRRSTR